MKKARKFIAVFLIFSGIMGISSVYSYIKYIRPKVVSVSQKFVEDEISDIIDHEIKKLMLEEFLNYDKITIITRDNSGNVTSISTNAVLINNFANDLDINIGKAIEGTDHFEKKVFLASLVGFEAFSGMGPKVPIRFEQISIAHVDISHTFEEAAINQTLHTVHITVSVDVEIMLPLAYSSITVKTQMPLAQTLIVGRVPQAYLNKK